MSLIKSISGLRGTIGGSPGDNLTPIDIVQFASAYGSWLKLRNKESKVVIGRDGRLSGSMVSELVANTLIGLGIDVVDTGYSTTPSVEMAVVLHQAQGGIILTASHNNIEWNALKLLNAAGEFLDGLSIQQVLDIAATGIYDFSGAQQLGKITKYKHAIEDHVQQILKLKLVQTSLVKKRKWKIVVDAINSTGAKAVPVLLDALGVQDYRVINSKNMGVFAHNPEPLTENLSDLRKAVIKEKAHFGIAVDPDVDRLVFIDENGDPFGEEYSLVAIADYVLAHQAGATVSNLSSSRALADVTKKYKCKYYAAAVGEVNVVAEMKKRNAVIGGEGNGGIILPELHYGRDALVGIALFMSLLAERKSKVSELRKSYTHYEMVKDKIALPVGLDMEQLLAQLATIYANEKTSTIDGLKIDFKQGWVHLRKSNTEPIIRIYSEAPNAEMAQTLANKIKEEMLSLL